MSFDARSRERLEALGRTLPQKLPAPAADPRATVDPARDTPNPRHRLESEQNPEALFRELMQASPDGSVPPHLLERLRHLEAAPPAPAPTSAGTPPQAPRPGAKRNRPSGPRRRSAPGSGDGGEGDLYAAFDDLLHLEGDDTPAPLPLPSRPFNDPLLPKPTLRSNRAGA
jgi:hypothetical protein